MARLAGKVALKAARVEALAAAATRAYGAPHVLYDNAGFWGGGGLDDFVTDLTEEGGDRIVAVNLKGVFLCCKYGIPALIAAGGGAVINTASAAGLTAQ